MFHIHIQRIYFLCVLTIYFDRTRIVNVYIWITLNTLTMVEHEASSYIPVLDVGGIESLYLIVIPIFIQLVRVYKE